MLPPLPGVGYPQSPQPYGTWPAAAPPEKRRRWPKVVLGIFIAFVVLIGAVVALGLIVGKKDVLDTASGPPPTLPKGAAPFVAPDGSFGAHFLVRPTKAPQEMTLDSEATGGELWMSKSPTGVYAVAVEFFKGGQHIDVPGSFKQATDGFSQGFGSAVTSTTRTTVDGHEAETFTLAPKVAGQAGSGIVIITSHALYIAFGLTPTNLSPRIDNFIASLRVP
jgi:hypothetical protein